ncbi:MAG TPA: ATP-binding protein [Rubrobacteraceae bacterium]|nr:ATP-binding protein [Rubrobacteraceae bacterium]
MEGPYRDLGNGFARLLGVEGLRRSPAKLRSVEDALFELLRNSRDANAKNIYVASSLKYRRYRALTVIDDGQGIPETHKHLVFEPGVTTRHLDPGQNEDDLLHGAGLSLYHIRNAALYAQVFSASSPTAVKVVFDTLSFPERSLQSGSRPSKTNLLATLARFADQAASPEAPRLYHAPPARILARLLKDRIIHHESNQGTGLFRKTARELGLEVSLRTVQRVISGEILAASEVVGGAHRDEGAATTGRAIRRNGSGGPILSLGAEDLADITDVLRRAARSSYLELAALDVEKRPGELVFRARIYEPEEEYE